MSASAATRRGRTPPWSSGRAASARSRAPSSASGSPGRSPPPGRRRRPPAWPAPAPSCRARARRRGTCAAPSARRHAGALERASSPPRRSTSSSGPSWARERRTSTIAASCSARRRSSTSAGVRRRPRPRTSAGSARAARAGTGRSPASGRAPPGRQREEGGDRLRVPVDVELEARLPHALDQRQRGRRRLEPDAQALRARGRARPSARRCISHSASAMSAPNGSHSRPPRSSRERRELLGQLAGDRLEHEAPGAPAAGADAPDPAGDGLGQPRVRRRDGPPASRGAR